MTTTKSNGKDTVVNVFFKYRGNRFDSLRTREAASRQMGDPGLKTGAGKDSTLEALNKLKQLSEVEKEKLFYAYFKKKSENDIKLIIAQDPEFFKGFSMRLIDGAKFLTGTSVSSLKTEWMPGEDLTCYRSFVLAVTIDEEYLQVFNKHALPGYVSLSDSLLSRLQKSALFFRTTSGHQSDLKLINVQIGNFRLFNQQKNTSF